MKKPAKTQKKASGNDLNRRDFLQLGALGTTAPFLIGAKAIDNVDTSEEVTPIEEATTSTVDINSPET